MNSLLCVIARQEDQRRRHGRQREG